MDLVGSFAVLLQKIGLYLENFLAAGPSGFVLVVVTTMKKNVMTQVLVQEIKIRVIVLVLINLGPIGDILRRVPISISVVAETVVNQIELLHTCGPLGFVFRGEEKDARVKRIDIDAVQHKTVLKDNLHESSQIH